MRHVGLTPRYVARVLAPLEGVFIERNNGSIRMLRPYKPFLSEVVAIEVKVGDWKSGLVQADQYLSASHKSYLALLDRKAPEIPAEVLSWARKKGIGILTVSREGKVKVMVKASSRGPLYKTAHYLLVESLWDKVVEMLRSRTVLDESLP